MLDPAANVAPCAQRRTLGATIRFLCGRQGAHRGSDGSIDPPTLGDGRQGTAGLASGSRSTLPLCPPVGPVGRASERSARSPAPEWGTLIGGGGVHGRSCSLVEEITLITCRSLRVRRSESGAGARGSSARVGAESSSPVGRRPQGAARGSPRSGGGGAATSSPIGRRDRGRKSPAPLRRPRLARRHPAWPARSRCAAPRSCPRRSS